MPHIFTLTDSRALPARPGTRQIGDAGAEGGGSGFRAPRMVVDPRIHPADHRCGGEPGTAAAESRPPLRRRAGHVCQARIKLAVRDLSPPTRTASASHWMSPSTGTTQHDAEPTGSSTASTRTSTPSRSTPSGTGATHTAPDLRGPLLHRLAPPRHPRRNPAKYYWASIRNLAGPRAGDARRGRHR